jgi:hypothetical protein
VLGDVVVDGLDELLDGTKTVSANGLSGDLGKPAFDLIKRELSVGVKCKT